VVTHPHLPAYPLLFAHLGQDVPVAMGAADDLESLVTQLARLPVETEWVEFKANNVDPVEIGEYISALANSTVLAARAVGYLVWGVKDHDHALIGTSFDPDRRKVGDEDLVNWLSRMLSPPVHFQFRKGTTSSGQKLVVLEVDASTDRPVAFKNVVYIRIGSYKKKIKDHPEHERRLWRAFETRSFETGLAAHGLGPDDVISLIDYPSYFELLGLPLPEGRGGILERFVADNIVEKSDDGAYGITNLGAVLFAKTLDAFPGLRRKVPRVVQYRGFSRVETIREQQGARGYASGFEGLISFLNGLLPENEIIGQALRTSAPLYPELAIRELMANALIHQDFSMGGTGPLIELFEDRLEIANPGTPLIEPARFIDSPPQSRNEALAAMLRRIGVCEERGSGWDKVCFEIEYHQLPPPLIEVTERHTRVTLFAPRALTRMDKSDRVRALYQHACLRYVNRQPMTNTSVRQRFGIESQNSALASRLIREAVDAGAVFPYDAEAGPRSLRYVPFWATSGASS
jgi:ATP-dependent DNA helicase RecG